MVGKISAKSGICCVAAGAAAAAAARGPRRRTLLKSGASWRALLAVPAAMTVGIVLTRPAQAAQPIAPTGSGVALAVTYNAGDNPFYINAGTLVSSAGIAIYGTSTSSWTITNAGTVQSSGTTALDFEGLGYVVNSGTINGDKHGVVIGSGGSLDNTGLITGNAETNGDGVRMSSNDATGVVVNDGSVGGFVGVQLSGGGYVGNQSNGTISGTHIGIYTDDGFATIVNAGTVYGEHGGIHVNSGGSVNNSGLVSGGSDYGINFFNAPGTLVNSGTMFGGGSVVGLADGGYVQNTGSILGGAVGVTISGGQGVIENNGFGDANYISGSVDGVVVSSADGTLFNRGVIVGSGEAYGNAAVVMNGGYIYNQGSNCATPAGTIAGYWSGISITGAGAATIVNAGLISAYGDAGPDSAGISLGSGGGTIINRLGGSVYSYDGDGVFSNQGNFSIAIAGSIYGWLNGIDSYNQSGPVANGSVAIDNSGTIFGHQDNGIYVNTGYASIVNTGSIIGKEYSGIALYAGGSVFNSGLIGGGDDGVYGRGAPVSVTNIGLIAGTYTTGVELRGGGYVYNASQFSQTGTIRGAYDGVYIGGGAGSVVNAGLISGAAYDGVQLAAGGTVVNLENGRITGAYSGVQVGYAFERQAYAGVLFNSGTIIGNTIAGVIMYGGGYVGNDGKIVDAAAQGYGVAMYTPNSTVVNYGEIQAGRFGQGVRLYNGGTVVNQGDIFSGLKGDGVYLRAGGVVYNDNNGFIEGGFGIKAGGMSPAYINNIGEIYGHTVGVQLLGGGKVDNYFSYVDDHFAIGKIYGRQVGVQVGDGGNVYNAGYIGGGVAQTYGIGVQLTNGGAVYNDSSYNFQGGLINATIVGGDTGVQIKGASGYVYNGGTIIGGRIGVALYNGGSIDNNHYYTRQNCQPFNAYGTIIGGEFGVYGGSLAAVGVTNEGYITGGVGGVDLAAGGSVYNANTGLITGGAFGVGMGAAGTVVNAGSIFGNAGVYLTRGGSVANTGTIGGGIGVLTGLGEDPFDFIGTPGVTGHVVNYGSIYGFEAGVAMDGGGYLSNASTGTIWSNDGWGVLLGTPTLSTSSVFNAGIIVGQSFGVAAFNFGETDVYNQTGTIGGGFAGVAFANAGAANLTNSSGGTVLGILDGVEIDNYGSIAGARVTNAGSIGGFLGDGVQMSGGSYTGVFNLSGGTMTGGMDGVAIFRGNDGYGFTTISNAGSIFGFNDGVSITGGAEVSVANLPNGTITGGDTGVYIHHGFDAGVSEISNAGSIYGNNEGVFVTNGTFAGVANLAGGTITSNVTAVDLNAAYTSLNNAGMIIASTDYSSGVSQSGTGDGMLVNQAGGTIQGVERGAAFDVDGTAYLDNSGVIQATGYDNDEAYQGVYIEAATAIVNNNTDAVIAGYYGGLYSSAFGFSLSNAGTIFSYDGEGMRVDDETLVSIYNAAGGEIEGYLCGIGLNGGSNTVVNAGLIEGYVWKGIEAYGSDLQITNLQGGTIWGYRAGIYNDAETFSLDNAGLIYNTQFDDYAEAVRAKGGGTSDIVNEQTGTIAGPFTAVYVAYGSIANMVNAGVVTGGNDAAILVDQQNNLVNMASGSITGGEDGVFLNNVAQAYNAGLVEGSLDTGLALFNGGNLDNVAGGTIAGGRYGVYTGYTLAGTLTVPGTVFNAGLITGGSIGAALFNGGQVSNLAGGVITGGTYGIAAGYERSTIANAGNVFNAGSIAGGAVAVTLADGGLVTNLAGGVIAGGAYGVTAGYAGATFANTATVTNAGLIEGGTAGVLLNNGGAVTNLAGGTIAGGGTGIDLPEGGAVANAGLISGGQDGIDVAAGQTADISNSGTIMGAAGAGVAMLGGGSLVNSAAGLIKGGVDGVIAASGSTIVNAGQIIDAPAAGHAGVLLDGASSLTNLPTGTISGEVGVLVSGNDATIVDAGAIISTDGGDAIQIAPQADPAQITLTTGSSLTGAIDGGGTAGQITLTGQNTLDDTIANFGAGSALTIAPGASWVGAGNWTIANVNNTGTFQGGMLNAPLNLTGNFTSTGTLQVVVTPTMSTQINVSGTAALSGGLTYIFAPGLYTPGKTYNFVVAAGGASGDITDVTYIGATPAYVSKTTNLLITGDTLGSDLVLGRVAPLDDSVFADENQNQAMLAQAANDELLGKATSDSGANAAACAAAEKVMPGETSPRGTSLASQMTGAVANAFCGAGGWIEATGSTMTIDHSGNAAGYSANDAGFLAGLDRDITSYDTKLGVAVGYDDAWLNDKAGGKATSDTFRVGLYAAQPMGIFTIAGDIMYGHANNTTTRATGIGAVGASFGSNIVNGGAQVNANLVMNGVAVTPAAGVKFAAADAGGFSETSSPLLAPFEVTGGNGSYTSVQPYVNLGLSKIFTTESQITIRPQATVGYTLDAGDRGKSVTVNSQDGTAFATGHTNLDAGAAQIEAGISAGKNNWALYAKYAALLSGNYTAQAGEAGLQIKF